jgi:hypothetical protein
MLVALPAVFIAAEKLCLVCILAMTTKNLQNANGRKLLVWNILDKLFSVEQTNHLFLLKQMAFIAFSLKNPVRKKSFRFGDIGLQPWVLVCGSVC